MLLVFANPYAWSLFLAVGLSKQFSQRAAGVFVDIVESRTSKLPGAFQATIPVAVVSAIQQDIERDDRHQERSPAYEPSRAEHLDSLPRCQSFSNPVSS